MNEEVKARLVENVKNSYKMYSNWVFAAIGTGALVWGQMDEPTRQTLLAHLPVPGWVVPLLTSVGGIVVRCLPQIKLIFQGFEDDTPTQPPEEKK